MSSKSKRFRELLERDGLVIRIGVYDALTAVLAEKAGFELLGTTGYGISATMLGQPDVGLVSFREMCDRVRNIARAVSVPVCADSDTGYGNAINVYRTVKEMIWAGAAGLFIEDQVWPKRCGHMFGKQIISTGEMVGKIKAAIDARDEEDPDFVVGARTDAIGVAGIDEAIKRGKAYAEAGADFIYVEAPRTIEEVKRAVKEIPAPISFNIIVGGKVPYFPLDELEAIGVKMVSFPLDALYAATKAIMDVYAKIKERRPPQEWEKDVIDWREFNNLIGYPRIKEMEKKYLPEEMLKKMYGDKFEEM